MIKELKDLSDIHRVTKRGIYKIHLADGTESYNKICDYMQKINFCIQDLNAERCNCQELTMKTIVYVTVLVDWLHEAVEAVEGMYREGVMDNFQYIHNEELIKARNYLRAIRSFMVAHPLSTNRHPKYGFDGDLICIDIRLPNEALSIVPESSFYLLNHNGQSQGKNDHADFYLYAYSRKVAHKVSSVYIGCVMSDIYRVAEIFIDKLYAMDKYLMTQKTR